MQDTLPVQNRHIPAPHPSPQSVTSRTVPSVVARAVGRRRADRLDRAYRTGMCRSIKTLRRPGEAATTGELEAAARQFVRKLSGYREPSAANREAFDAAIADVAEAGRRLIESIGVDVEVGPDRWTPGSGRPRDRQRVLA